MKLLQTSVSATSIRMRFANDADPTKASQWVDFQVPLDQLGLSDLERQLLAELRLAALRHARGVIGDEVRRISELLDQRH